jgi:soluble lytic murein transglycosylase
MVEAREQLAEIARDFPFSYYGWRAQMRLGAAGPGPGPSREPLEESPGRLAPEALRRARILIEAGMSEEARAEIARHVTGARSLSDRLKLAQLATDAGDYNQAQRLVVDAYSGQLARGPIRRFEDLWWYAWPSAFSPEVGHATRSEGSVEPALVYSIMREESGYRPDVISPVGARGLLQIMTATGEVLAQKQGLDVFDADDLFVPRTNISLGAGYLAELSNQFDGRLSASIASYNAGPEAVREWISEVEVEDAGDRDDEWVESIPYEQTRNYVKRVLRSLYVYRTLY